MPRRKFRRSAHTRQEDGTTMKSGHGGWAGKLLAALMICLIIVGSVIAQAPPAPRRGRLRNQGGAPLKKVRPDAGDPLIKAIGADAKGKAKAAVPASYHYTFRLHAFDGNPLAASYYPSRLGGNAPVVMLIHEANRSRKDFEEQVEGLKGLGLAEHLQDEGYAVLSIDLRGQGQNPRRMLNSSDRILLVRDLQAAYIFLLDRHNRGDFNVSKLGVIAVGEGANLAAAWAYQPGASVSTEGRPGDLNALVLLSPFPEVPATCCHRSFRRWPRGFRSRSWPVPGTTLPRTLWKPQSGPWSGGV